MAYPQPRRFFLGGYFRMGQGKGKGKSKKRVPGVPVEAQVVATNRRAAFDYEIEDRLEAGLVLTGTEVKSARDGRVQFTDAYARIEGGEAWLLKMHIAPYTHAGELMNHDPERTRKLLLHKREIKHLIGKVQQKGYTLIPVALYFRNGHAKVQLALARGKRKYDKREKIREREAQRETERHR